MSLPIALFCSLCADVGGQENPEYTLRISPWCDEVIDGAPGAILDDGSSGAPFFTKPVPGYNFDVILRIEKNRWPLSNQRWEFGVTVDGGFRIMDITTNGTVSCLEPGPGCHRRAGYEISEITGPPLGAGPQDPANVGAVSAVLLSVEPVSLPPEGEFVVAKLRISGMVPDQVGSLASGTIRFVKRTGTADRPIGPVVYKDLVIPVSPDSGDPPLTLEQCNISIRAMAEAAFLRCDTNGDANATISDAIWLLNQLLGQDQQHRCVAAADCNADGHVAIADAIFLLMHLFNGGSDPAEPFPSCGRVSGLPIDECPVGSSNCR
jgi:hypothetical protein